MIPTPLLGALLGLMFVAGIGLMVAGVVGSTGPFVVRPIGDRWASPRLGRPQTLRVGAGFGIGIVVAMLTGWPALVVVIAGAAWFVPEAVDVRRTLATDRRRLAAIASWVESFRDLIGGSSASVEQAIAVSADIAPALIRPEIARLRDETVQYGTRVALTQFTERLADPVVDQVGWALLIASEQGGGSVTELLSQAARNIRSMVAARDKIEAGRAKSWTVVNTIAIVTFGVGGLFFVTQPSTRLYFASGSGQVMLAIACVLNFGGLFWMGRLSQTETRQRVPLSFDDEHFVARAAGRPR